MVEHRCRKTILNFYDWNCYKSRVPQWRTTGWMDQTTRIHFLTGPDPRRLRTWHPDEGLKIDLALFSLGPLVVWRESLSQCSAWKRQIVMETERWQGRDVEKGRKKQKKILLGQAFWETPVTLLLWTWKQKNQGVSLWLAWAMWDPD